MPWRVTSPATVQVPGPSVGKLADCYVIDKYEIAVPTDGAAPTVKCTVEHGYTNGGPFTSLGILGAYSLTDAQSQAIWDKAEAGTLNLESECLAALAANNDIPAGTEE